jgi:hypothetical protein
MLEQYKAVTKEDVIKILKNHVLRLFDPATSVAVVVTAPGKSDEIAAALTEKGFDVEKKAIEDDDDGSGSESGSYSSDESM